MVKGILINRRMEEAAALRSLLKMEHADLIAEMQTIENLPTHERLQLARIRRAQQLKVARQKEKEWLKLERMKGNIPSMHNTNGGGPVGALNRHKMKPNGVTDMLVESAAARKHISFENSVVLLEAASRNDMQEVVDLLEAGITPDAANEDGLTALHQCCIDNNVDMLKLLLEYGANVDAQDSDKWTPLHAAATCGHLELVRILVEHDANLLAVNTDGNMPYDLCDDETTLDFIEAEMSKRGVTQELIDETRSATEVQMLNDLMEIARAESDLEFSDQQGATPLHIAAANGYARVVEFLLEMHVNVDAADHDLWTPVHAAACWGHLEVLEMLAQCGADLNVRNKDNETPSDICEDPEIRERIEQLKTEQESKRLAEAQRRRVRRSQSNNTRAQSVRRTSLRDKTLTTKKDAVEEARLRLQAQEVFTVTSNGGTTTATNVDGTTAFETKSIDVGTQAKQTTTTTTFGLSSMSSIYSHLSSSKLTSTTAEIENNNEIITNHAANINAGVTLPKTNRNNNTSQNHAESINRHYNNTDNSHNQQQKQIQNQQHENYTLNGVGIDAGVGGFLNSTSTTQNGYGSGIDGMQLVKDELDATTNNQSYLMGRPTDTPHVIDDSKHYFLNGYKSINTERSETVQVQSSKEAANGQINVQVTVLVGESNLLRCTLLPNRLQPKTYLRF